MVVWIEEDAYLDAREVCELLRVKPQTLYAYVSRGLLRSFRQGIRRRRLYLKREAEALVELAPGSAHGRGTKPAARSAHEERTDRSVRDGRAARILPDEPGDKAATLPRAEEWIGEL